MDFTPIFNIFRNFFENTHAQAEILWPKIITAILLLIVWAGIAYGIFRLIMYIFARFKLLDLIDKIWDNVAEHTSSMVEKNNPHDKKEESENPKLIKKVRYDRIVAKASSYYVFLMYFFSFFDGQSSLSE